jgi:hypothetical protein
LWKQGGGVYSGVVSVVHLVEAHRNEERGGVVGAEGVELKDCMLGDHCYERSIRRWHMELET